MSYELIQVRTEAEKVGIITLNRPKQLNALNSELMVEMGDCSEDIRCRPPHWLHHPDG